jgi:hypothetical protein
MIAMSTTLRSCWRKGLKPIVGDGTAPLGLADVRNR